MRRTREGRREWGDNEKYKVAGFNIRNLNNRFPTPQQRVAASHDRTTRKVFTNLMYIFCWWNSQSWSSFIRFQLFELLNYSLKLHENFFSPLKTWFHLVSLRDSIANSKSDHHHKSTHSTSWDFRFTDRREICCEEQSTSEFISFSISTHKHSSSSLVSLGVWGIVCGICERSSVAALSRFWVGVKAIK